MVFNMIQRDLYLNQLEDLKNTNTIKILTGICRCGKSSILLSFIEKLKDEGIDENHIIYLNMDLIKNREFKDYLKLYDQIKSQIILDQNKNYIFLDNISKVKNWVNGINALSEEFGNDVDIYITGLDGNISEELRASLNLPVVDINILPLSFKEYLLFDQEYWHEKQSIEDKFNDYLHYGSLPLIFEHKKSDSLFNNILKGVYTSIIVKNLLVKSKIKNTILLEEIFSFAISNLGEYISSKKITEYFKKEGVKTTPTTVLEYFKHLDKSYLFYSSKRYNLKCNVYLRTLEKHYISDLGIRNAILGFEDEKSQGVLENLVYFELLRRDYNISMVKLNNHKIDFLAIRPDKRQYYQVIKNLNDDTILNKKIKALEAVRDSYEKIIITFDKTHIKNIKGIKIMNIIDFLCADDDLLL